MIVFTTTGSGRKVRASAAARRIMFLKNGVMQTWWREFEQPRPSRSAPVRVQAPTPAQRS